MMMMMMMMIVLVRSPCRVSDNALPHVFNNSVNFAPVYGRCLKQPTPIVKLGIYGICGI